MPTMSKLAAAVCFAILAWIVSAQVMDTMPEREQWGNFQPFNALVALLVGWFIVGRRLRVDYVTAIGIGFTGMVAAVFWVIFCHSFNEMIQLSLARRFDGPVEAIVSIFKLGIEYAIKLAHPQILATLGVGGMVTGVIAEFVDRRWA